MLGEELNGLVNRHLKYIVNVLSFEFHFQGIALETFAVTGLTFQYQVGHELHLYGHRTFSLTLFAPSAFGIE